MSAANPARRRLVAHGVAAVFHDHDLLVVALHVRQGLRQDAGDVVRADGHGTELWALGVRSGGAVKAQPRGRDKVSRARLS